MMLHTPHVIAGRRHHLGVPGPRVRHGRDTSRFRSPPLAPARQSDYKKREGRRPVRTERVEQAQGPPAGRVPHLSTAGFSTRAMTVMRAACRPPFTPRRPQENE